ncbi:MAG: type II toxin-antitoxin system VapC family toxin [Actinobacteria bacterium]|nr:type II toxin-antitoxin system VapC family toxin [Actinomycetota bacterium]
MADRALVVDASVALKWVVTEDGSVQANGLLDQVAGGGLTLVAPGHLLGEVGNGLRKRVAQRVLTRADAIAGFDAIGRVGIEFVSGRLHWGRTLRAALDWNLTTYDALYLLLAEDLGVDLVTADRRLIDAARHHHLAARTLSV